MEGGGKTGSNKDLERRTKGEPYEKKEVELSRLAN